MGRTHGHRGQGRVGERRRRALSGLVGLDQRGTHLRDVQRPDGGDARDDDGIGPRERGSERRARARSIASLSSVRCTALLIVLRATSGSSTNEPPNVVVKPAVTDRNAVIVVVQMAAAPEQAPLQPVNVAPAPAMAVKATTVCGA